MIANKNMSFLKITDPKKRDFIANEFLKTRQNIQHNFLSERVGDLSTQYELAKLFKPVTDMQQYQKSRPCKRIETNQRRNEKLTKGHNISTIFVHNSQ